MGYSPPGSPVHGIAQARILEWVAIPFSRGSSWPGDGTHDSCIGRRFVTTGPPGKPTLCLYSSLFSGRFKACLVIWQVLSIPASATLHGLSTRSHKVILFPCTAHPPLLDYFDWWGKKHQSLLDTCSLPWILLHASPVLASGGDCGRHAPDFTGAVKQESLNPPFSGQVPPLAGERGPRPWDGAWVQLSPAEGEWKWCLPATFPLCNILPAQLFVLSSQQGHFDSIGVMPAICKWGDLFFSCSESSQHK